MFAKLTVAVAVIALLTMGTVTAVKAETLYGTLKKIKETGTINLGHREASVPFA
jgi:glutamate/aspartate transport system substrate-binding protein